MLSHRDHSNPDMIRFPGNLLPKVLIVVGLFFNALSAVISALSYIAWWNHLFDAILISTSCWLLIRCWPGELSIDPGGVQSRQFLSRRTIRIPWTEVETVEIQRELGGDWAAAKGLRTDVLIIQGRANAARVCHTPRHSDRERFLMEMKRIGRVPAHVAGL